MVAPGQLWTRLVIAALATSCTSSPALVDGGIAAADAALGADAGLADAAPPTPEIYPEGPTHSPITDYVAANLRAIAAADDQRDDHSFAKVGDSITVDANFLHCLAGTTIDWAEHDQLAPVRDAFAAASPEPFDRDSFAAGVGWNAREPMIHQPGLDDELAAMNPRFALLMFGTNDVGWHDIDWFGGNMLDLVDLLIDGGVVPILSTIPPRDDSTDADAEVPRHNAVVRGIAQARQVPLVDFHRELMPIPGHGLWGDGVHPNVYSGGGCVFTETALGYGQNVRNLITMEALGRVEPVVVDGASAPDPAVASVAGSGAPDDPVRIPGLPFSDLRDTSQSPHREVDRYPGCDADQDESGPELYYRLELVATTAIRAIVIDRGEVDIDLHLLEGGTGGDDCVLRAHQVIATTLPPGTYYFSLDSFVDGEVERSGEYLFVVMEDPP